MEAIEETAIEKELIAEKEVILNPTLQTLDEDLVSGERTGIVEI